MHIHLFDLIKTNYKTYQAEGYDENIMVWDNGGFAPLHTMLSSKSIEDATCLQHLVLLSQEAGGSSNIKHYIVANIQNCKSKNFTSYLIGQIWHFHEKTQMK